MTAHSQTLFDQATEQLRRAQSALEAGQYGESEKLALQASETIAAGYLSKYSDAAIVPPEKAFRAFVDKIWDAGTTLESVQDIRGVVGDVVVLREAFEPNLLHEATTSDAEMMLVRVIRLQKIVTCL